MAQHASPISLDRQGSTGSMRSVDTPTRLRMERNVNSPKVRRQDVGSQFAAANKSHNDNDLPTHLITQVARPGEAAKPGQQPSPQENAAHQSNLIEAEKKQCCWWCLPLCGGMGKSDRNGAQTELVAADRSAAAQASQQAAGGGMSQSHQNSVAVNDEMHYGPNAGGRGGHQAEESSSGAQHLPDYSKVPPGLLEPLARKNYGKKCLVLDLDETLVHSSFKPVNNADFIVPVEIDGVVYKVYVLKRPFVDHFLKECAKHYELVVFTASLSKYANPLLNMLDPKRDKNGKIVPDDDPNGKRMIEHRLFRESCVLHGQAYVKDLSKLGRRMEDVIFVDNSPLSYAFQPTSAVPILS